MTVGDGSCEWVDMNLVNLVKPIQAVEKVLLYLAEAVVHVREVGTDWVSLSWKRPDGKMKMPPIVTYKVEAWLCGEGAYWVEVRPLAPQNNVLYYWTNSSQVGRSPITQFDAFNLKPNRQYYFRVTAKSRRGVEFELMTKGKVDLSKSTEMPKFTKQMPNYLRILEGQPLALSCEVRKALYTDMTSLFNPFLFHFSFLVNHYQKPSGTTPFIGPSQSPSKKKRWFPKRIPRMKG